MWLQFAATAGPIDSGLWWSPERTEFEDKLKPGDYLFVSWDILIEARENQWPPEIQQIGLSNAHHQTLLLNVTPEGSDWQTKMNLMSYVMQKGI